MINLRYQHSVEMIVMQYDDMVSSSECSIGWIVDGTTGRYRIQEGIVDSYGITLGFKGLDAQAVFPLSTGEGQKETGKRPTREQQRS